MEFIKARLRVAGANRLYPNPFPCLEPERMWFYLDTLIRTKDVPGAVLEIGCAFGGTASFACRMLRNLNCSKDYICVDTFGGFVTDQFNADVKIGTLELLRDEFKICALPLVTKLMKRWGTPEVRLVKTDIVSCSADTLPPTISVALVDVDLDVPTAAALEKVFPRLARGGVILVDDCHQDSNYVGARVAYERFMATRGLPPKYSVGMGICMNLAEAARPETSYRRQMQSAEQ